MQHVVSHPLRADPLLLEARVSGVQAARARLIEARGAAPRNWDSQAARDELLDALELLAAAMAGAGAPLPYRLHAEIELYRKLDRRS